MPSSPDLAQRVADRLCHDLMGSVQGMTGALDLLAEATTSTEREDAVSLLGQALASLKAKIRFAREAFGPRTGSTPSAQLASLAASLFTGLRSDLEWCVQSTSLEPSAAAILLNLVQIGADCVASGGRVRAATGRDTGQLLLEVEARGPRPRLRPDIAAALCGTPHDEAPTTRSVQGAFVRALSLAAGGEINVATEEQAIVLRVSLPSPI